MHPMVSILLRACILVSAASFSTAALAQAAYPFEGYWTSQTQSSCAGMKRHFTRNLVEDIDLPKAIASEAERCAIKSVTQKGASYIVQMVCREGGSGPATLTQEIILTGPDVMTIKGQGMVNNYKRCPDPVSTVQAQTSATNLEREQLLAEIFTNLQNLTVAPGVVTSSYKTLSNSAVTVEVRAKDNCNLEYRKVEAFTKNGKIDGYALTRRTVNLTRVGAIEPRRDPGGGLAMPSVSPGFGGRKMICGSYDTRPKPEFTLPLECKMDWTGASDWFTLDVGVETTMDQLSAVMTRVINAEKAYLTKYCPSKLASLIKEVDEQLGEKSPMAGGSPQAATSPAGMGVANQASGSAPASIIDALVARDDGALRKAMRANLPSYNCAAEDDLLRCTDGQYEVKATVAKRAFFFQLEVSKDPDRFPQSRAVFQLIDRLGSAIGLPPADINGCWRASDSRIFVQKRSGLKIACQTQSQFTKQMVLVVQPDTSF